jgi:hypothetical protein
LTLANFAQLLKVRVLGVFSFSAYCDESYDPRVFCIAGVVAPAAWWTPFEAAWTAVLRNNGLSEFKASDCEHHRAEFEGWEPERRARLQEQLIETIRASRVRGMWASLDSAAFGAMSVHPFDAVAFDDPYFLLFGFQVTNMVKLAEKVTEASADRGLSAHEDMAFVFDEQQEWSGRALQLYQALKRGPGAPSYANHLGGIAFADSVVHPGLQAADLLAFEARRFVGEVVLAANPSPERWQWQRLYEKATGARRVWGTHLSTENLTMLKRDRDDPASSEG